MKNPKYLLLIAVLVSLVSCSKDENPGVDVSLVLGEWNLEEITYSGTSTVTQGGQTLTSSYTGEAIDLDARVIFNNDNKFRTEGSYTIKVITTVMG